MKTTQKLSKKDVKKMKKSIKDLGKLDKLSKKYQKNLKDLNKMSEKIIKRKKIDIEEGIEMIDIMCELEDLSKKLKKKSTIDF